jgi:hypothetical protein
MRLRAGLILVHDSKRIRQTTILAGARVWTYRRELAAPEFCREYDQLSFQVGEGLVYPGIGCTCFFS